MNFGLIHSVWTVLMFVLFIGIIVWAWSAKRKRGFDEAARLPLEDEDSHLLPLSPRGRGQRERGEPLIPTLSPTHLPPAGEGSSVRSAPARPTQGKKHG